MSKDSTKVGPDPTEKTPPEEAGTAAPPAVREPDRDDGALTVQTRRAESFLEDFKTKQQVAKTLSQSGMVPDHYRGDPRAVFTGMLKGAELGLPPMTALENLYVISGKTGMEAQLMKGLCIDRAGCRFDSERLEDPTGARVTVERPDHGAYTAEFDMDDAERIEDPKTGKTLAQKNTYRNYPYLMCLWRATSEACRVMCPDVLTGVHTPEELDPALEIEPESGAPKRGPGIYGTAEDEVQRDADSRAGEMLDEMRGQDDGEEPEGPDATSAAIELARDALIPLSEVEGSGEGGRILVGDVEEALQERDLGFDWHPLDDMTVEEMRREAGGIVRKIEDRVVQHTGLDSEVWSFPETLVRFAHTLFDKEDDVPRGEAGRVDPTELSAERTAELLEAIRDAAEEKLRAGSDPMLAE